MGHSRTLHKLSQRAHNAPRTEGRGAQNITEFIIRSLSDWVAVHLLLPGHKPNGSILRRMMAVMFTHAAFACAQSHIPYNS
jgi:hypothetical protein